ncbi:hypothetical protein L1049_009198 [Liquidambar formosana]|uniref:Myb-like domain-containing protein n=1 Tax=Liquidambar formosana TaxID=63359 RepID=A0AAP0S4Y0_LIQFO
MEMEDQYGMTDLRQLMNNGRAHFPPAIPQPPDLFSGHRNLTPSQQHHYEMMMVGRQVSDHMMQQPRGLHDQFRADHSTTTATITSVTATSTATTLSGLESTEAGGCLVGGDGGTGRWPRQETLTLLDIRSRLDSKFKEANQKGPLWDEVSRIMSEEHGYQRSGKKCREKFENLYKYYKKTKEGKAGRQDGKHYRFFRQLEALYGETSNTPVSVSETHFQYPTTASNTPSTQPNQEPFQSHKLCDSLSLSNYSEFDTSSSDDNDLNTANLTENDSAERGKKRRGSRRSWKAKIKDFIDSQMRKLMEKQEAWLEKMMKTIENKEQERVLREEEWRKQEADRLEREHKFWANERAWIQTRDAALMEALQKLSGREVKASSPEELMAAEIQNLGENMNENGSETFNNYVRKSTKECNKKRKENSKGCCYYQNNNDSIYNQGGAYCEINEQEEPESIARLQTNDGSSPCNSNAGNHPAAHDSCFRFLMGDGENLWENYGVKLNKGEN